MRNHPFTSVEFCAGYGGLGLGIKAVLGDSVRTIGYCELEGFAQANLISKMEAGHLDAAPVWPDVRTFPYAKFRGLVDIACAGIPCQPHSHAGKRAGGSDERFLFDDWLDGVELMQPGTIFIENVEGLLSSKMPDGTLCIQWCIERLEGMAYRTTWGIFSASEVGAPHQRKRVFILAHRISAGSQGLLRSKNLGLQGEAQSLRPAWESSISTAWPSRPGQPQHDWEPPRVVDTKSQRVRQRSELRGEECGSGSALPRDIEQSGEGRVVDSTGARQQAQRDESNGKRREGFAGESGELGNSKSRQDHGREPRDMGIETSQGRCGDHAAYCTGEVLGNTNSTRPQERAGQGGEGIQGAHANGGEDAERQIESPLGRNFNESTSGMDYAQLCVSCDNRTDELRLLGNGVVPATAALAFRTLLARFERRVDLTDEWI